MKRFWQTPVSSTLNRFTGQNRPNAPQASPPVEEPKAREATPEETRQELQAAIKGSNELLVHATTAVSLFPDTIVVDRAKLTVTKRTFFNTADVVSMRIEDILNITASVGPILGSVQISSRVVNSKPYTVGKFWRRDALALKRITQGYVIALQRKIDCSALPTKELVAMLDRLGEDEHNTSQVA